MFSGHETSPLRIQTSVSLGVAKSVGVILHFMCCIRPAAMEDEAVISFGQEEVKARTISAAIMLNMLRAPVVIEYTSMR